MTGSQSPWEFDRRSVESLEKRTGVELLRGCAELNAAVPGGKIALLVQSPDLST